jgi:hypothetical protein
MWNLCLVRLETMLVQHKCTVCAKRTIGSEVIWTHPKVLLGDRLKSKLNSVHLEIVRTLTQDRCLLLRRMYHRLINGFGRTRWNSLVMWVMWSLISVHLDTELVSVQHRCMVCAKHTIGSKIILDAPDGTTRPRVSSRSLFRSVWR